ncbi:hypothetical protein [Sphingomonas sp. Ant20]|uniref:hypothetical protein n=1 Tax=Sphingomonas sp. Ant20 TaxID=104605 RepID=UPI00053720DA|nr:hypothetical protein [Sphingomonas sp. Ant20]KHA63302.1 hypothetical protein NI18_16930 [Sphingomonas sp. Ant20]
MTDPLRPSRRDAIAFTAGTLGAAMAFPGGTFATTIGAATTGAALVPFGATPSKRQLAWL